MSPSIVKKYLDRLLLCFLLSFFELLARRVFLGGIWQRGELEASGELALSPVYAWRVELLLHPVNDVSADTLDWLEQSAQRQPNGDYSIDTSGQF